MMTTISLKKEQCKFYGNKNHPMKKEITINLSKTNDLLPFHENEQVFLKINSETDEYLDICRISYKKYSENNQAEYYLSKELENYFQDKELILQTIPHKEILKYSAADLENVRDDRLEIAESIFSEMKAAFPKHKIIGLEVINNLNGCSVYFKKEQIKENAALKDLGIELKLSMKIRKLLDIELPTFISQYYLSKLQENSQVQDYEKYCGKIYKNEQTTIDDKDFFDRQKGLRKLFAVAKISPLAVYPVFEKKKSFAPGRILKEIVNCLTQPILNVFIGKKEIRLRAIRPYPIDESEYIVRATESAMYLLGVDNMDNVCIRFGDSQVRAKILKIEDPEIILKQNRVKSPQELNLLIGIPAHLRKELGMNHINYGVTIGRDMRYLFRKNLNLQLMSIVGLIISFMVIINEIDSFLGRILVMLGLTFAFIYMSFSELRAKIRR